MIPTISIFGRPGSGKTTLLEALIPLLRAKGYRIGIIKHGEHGFSLDEPGKDSWRLAKAGAEVSVVSTPQGLGVFRSLNQEWKVEELRESYLSDMDLILAEGYKNEKMPKIEVHGGQPEASLVGGEQEDLVAVVSDDRVPVKVPVFSPNDLQSLADFLEERFLQRRQKEGIQVLVDGHPVPLNPFVKDLFRSLLLAMVAPLKGIGPFSRISLRLDTSGPTEERKANDP